MTGKKSDELKIGIFVTISIIFLFASIILIGGDKAFFTSYYHLTARFKHVQGLAPGSVVSLSGIRVGNVQSINFLVKEGMVEVVLDIEQDFSSKITEGSIASVRTQGALGDKYVYIEPGLPNSPQLKGGDVLPADSQGDFLDFLASKGAEFGKALAVIDEVHTLLKNINQNNRSALLMENLVSSSSNLNKLLVEATEVVASINGGKGKENELKTSIAHLSSVLEKIDRGSGTLGALINDRTIHDKIMNILGESPRNKYLKPLIRATIKKKK